MSKAARQRAACRAEASPGWIQIDGPKYDSKTKEYPKDGSIVHASRVGERDDVFGLLAVTRVPRGRRSIAAFRSAARDAKPALVVARDRAWT